MNVNFNEFGMKKLLLACLPMLMLTACGGPKYEVQDDVVVRSYWTFSFGTRCDTLPGADPVTFKQVSDWLGHDSKRVYFEATPVPGVDVATVRAKRYPLYCDKNDYYYMTKPLHVVDMPSFKTINWQDNDVWAKDSRCVYYDSLRLDGVDMATFQVVNRDYAVDKNHVYMDGVVLAEADPATFETMANVFYYRDKSHVWYFKRMIEGADPSTFRSIENTNFNIDKSHVWYEERLIAGADPATFEVLGKTNYCRDKSHIWFRDELLPDADHATFVADYESFAHDKKGTFTASHRDVDEPVPGDVE